MRRDSIGGTFLVAAVLCIVCSVLVSGVAVGLKSKQEKNKELDRQRNILLAAQLIDKEATNDEVTKIFDSKVKKIIIDLDTGERVDNVENPPVDIKTFDQKESLAKEGMHEEIPTDAPKDERLGPLKEREKYSWVYLIEEEGKLSTVVLPFYGKGLWSTMYGYVALKADAETVLGLTYYEHGETPGLGGEVDNELWKAQWNNTKAIDDDGSVVVSVVKAGTQGDGLGTIIDGLSGATITTKGVNTMIRYWLGPGGFGPFLTKVRKGEFNG
ncbi:Na(+)-translocating NADH-quinone reductase subunit C [Blastopirellula marina]|uniref:Na(+)-translocating NADH-quinone reductase subunit C n=1 Tax=Blastopirellula marina TaxID=124 RepID=A0A2S8FD59_9BACT|nr:Na(+)-translocating NADH-quinone reductase subunit C [Blastopirellula marina]PQO30103.1 Na(+)-translocating NADH-quinone reductase subunit C [Blastopirellula marina]PQO43162.1 Na(+)-translocating NADH-quinone reductase subunit C [Blastopirellula marina]PTL42541.1 Na(+)-translocating NADH-quinone reductase subunit C [Blastopirellula marina]